MILSTFPFLLIELISNEFAFSDYILTYLTKLTAPAAAATLSDDVVAAITTATTRAATEAAMAATAVATTAVPVVAGINILRDYIIRDWSSMFSMSFEALLRVLLCSGMPIS
jgi:hypothetical protein